MTKRLAKRFDSLKRVTRSKSVGTVGTVGTELTEPQKTAASEEGNLFPSDKTPMGTVGTQDDPVPTVPTNGNSSGNRIDASKAAENCDSLEVVPTVPTVPTKNEQATSEPEWDDELEERAALIAEGSGCPAEWAEGFARLDPNFPPADITANRWRVFVDDCGRFIDQWASHAAALGWGPADLFGCDRQKPLARIDQAGLLWLINGRRLIALSEQEAIIETPNGGRLTYRRSTTAEPGRAALAWDLQGN